MTIDIINEMKKEYSFVEDENKSKGVIFILIYCLIGTHYIDLPTLHLFGKVDLMVETLLFFLMLFAAYISFVMRQMVIKKYYLFGVLLPFVAIFYVFYGIVVVNNNPHRVFYEYQPFMYYFSFFLPLVFIRNLEDAEFFIKGIIFTTIIFVPFLILQYFAASKGIIFLAGKGLTIELGEDVERFVPKAENILLLISFYSYWRIIRNFNIKNLLYFMLFVFALILTFSRNLWVGFVIGVLIISWSEKHTLFRKLPIIIPGGGLFLLVLFLIITNTGLGQNILLRIGMISYSAVNSDNSLKWRVYETEMAIQAIKKSPLIGHGLGYKYHNKEYFESAPYYLHNNYLFIWMKMGIIGLIALGVFLLGLIKEALNVYKEHNRNDIFRGIAISTVAFMAAMIPASIVKPIFAESPSTIILLSLLYGIFIRLKVIAQEERLCSQNRNIY